MPFRHRIWLLIFFSLVIIVFDARASQVPGFDSAHALSTSRWLAFAFALCFVPMPLMKRGALLDFGNFFHQTLLGIINFMAAGMALWSLEGIFLQSPLIGPFDGSFTIVFVFGIGIFGELASDPKQDFKFHVDYAVQTLDDSIHELDQLRKEKVAKRYRLLDERSTKS